MRTFRFGTVAAAVLIAFALIAAAACSSVHGATGRVITVAGTNAVAIDAAFKKARGGDTVHFRAGTYTHKTLNVPSGVNVTGSGIGRTDLKFSITFGSRSRIGGSESKGLLIGDSGVALLNRGGASNSVFSFVRFRGGGPRSGVDYARYTDSSPYYTSYDPVVQLGEKGHRRSASHIRFSHCEFERPAGPYVSTHVRANVISMWEDNRAGYSHLSYLTFYQCHFGVKNPAGQYGAVSANVELKTNSYGDGSFDHNWHDVVFRDSIFERSGDFNLDFTDAARSWLEAHHLRETGNWTKVPMRYHAGSETGRSVSVIGGQIKGAGYSSDRWPYVFCLENAIGAPLRDVRIWGGAPPAPAPQSASPACGPILHVALPTWPLPLHYDARGIIAVYGNTYTPGAWGSYTPSPYDP